MLKINDHHSHCWLEMLYLIDQSSKKLRFYRSLPTFSETKGETVMCMKVWWNGNTLNKKIFKPRWRLIQLREVFFGLVFLYFWCEGQVTADPKRFSIWQGIKSINCCILSLMWGMIGTLRNARGRIEHFTKVMWTWFRGQSNKSEVKSAVKVFKHP